MTNHIQHIEVITISVPELVNIINTQVESIFDKKFKEVKREMQKETMTADEVMQTLGYTSRSTLDDLKNNGYLIPCSEPGKKRLYNRSDVEAFRSVKNNRGIRY